MAGKVVGGFAVLLLSGLCGVFALSSTASAQGSWTSGEFTWGERKVYKGPSAYDQKCTPSFVTIIGVTAQTDKAQVCIYERPSFRYGVYHKFINAGYLSRTDSYFVAARSGESRMYVVNGMSPDRLPLEVPESDDLHFNTLTMGFTNNHKLTYIPNFHKKLYMSDPFGELKRYNVSTEGEVPFIPHYNNSPFVTTGAVGVSENGDWMIAEIMGAGLVKIDTKTKRLYGFSNYIHRYGVGSDAHMTFRVSNDGTRVAVFDYNVFPTIYSLHAGCEVSAERYSADFESKLRSTACTTDQGRLYNALSQKYSWQMVRSMRASNFNTDGDTLYFDEYAYEDPNDMMKSTIYRLPLYSAGYVKEEGVEYLALGDSFTSGEGDIEKKADGGSYYMHGTAGKNECHVSSRSYPFLIRNRKDIEPGRMKSVACSGAQILPDYMAPVSTYPGQNKRLASLPDEVRKEMKEISLTSFEPGNVPQFEFIKKHHPKAITLMGGGNDVGFASILEYCASPGWEGIFTDETCGYAIEGHPLRRLFAQTIQGQYGYTLTLLRKIKQVSPETTVYVIGYPSFISEQPGVNCFNSAALDSSERKMINEGVTFMNTMLENAATSMGMRYVDIQDTLEGGRLCEGSEYVTGVTNVIAQMSDRDTHELFHPNAKAHEKFTQRILAKGFRAEANRNTETLSEAIELEIPSYFGSVEQKQTLQHDVTEGSVTEQSEMVVYMSDGSLAPGTDVTLTMFSKIIDLGDISANENGGLNASVTLPAKLKPGRHVLVLDGFSPSGEPLQYFQFVTVVSQTEGDEDGDGVPDENDPCLFITSWIDDTTQKDACTAVAEHSDEEKNEEVPVVRELSKLESGSQSKQSKASGAKHGAISSDGSAVGDESSESWRNRNNLPTDGSTSIVTPEVLGAHSTREPSEDKPKTAMSYDKLVFGGVVGISTLLAVYGIVRLARRNI